jgi:RHS repeat-associated protein
MVMTPSTSGPLAQRPPFCGYSTGKERDNETGLDYFGARYLSAAQGRWTSPDEPFADQHPADPQSWNLYGYVRNNPLISVDPQGRQQSAFPQNGQVTYYLYDKVSAAGEHLKFGMTTNPWTRYTNKELAGGYIEILFQGPDKGKIEALERLLHKNLPLGLEEGQTAYIAVQEANEQIVKNADKMRLLSAFKNVSKAASVAGVVITSGFIIRDVYNAPPGEKGYTAVKSTSCAVSMCAGAYYGGLSGTAIGGPWGGVAGAVIGGIGGEKSMDWFMRRLIEDDGQRISNDTLRGAFGAMSIK